MKKAIVLCAGNATRMRPFSYYINKSMIPVHDGRPVIYHIMQYLSNYDFHPIIALSKINHPEQIINYLSDLKYPFDYSVSDKPLGTAGEVKNAEKYLKDEKEFLVYYGDTLTDLDLNKLIETHQEDYWATLTGVRRQYEYGVLYPELNFCSVKIKEPYKISKIQEKPILKFLTNLPIFYCNSKILEKCKKGKDFSKDIFPEILSENGQIGLYIHNGFYKDYGNLSEYVKE